MNISSKGFAKSTGRAEEPSDLGGRLSRKGLVTTNKFESFLIPQIFASWRRVGIPAKAMFDGDVSCEIITSALTNCGNVLTIATQETRWDGSGAGQYLEYPQ